MSAALHHKPFTAVQIKRCAQWTQLVLSLPAPQSPRIAEPQPLKQKPGTSVFGTA